MTLVVLLTRLAGQDFDGRDHVDGVDEAVVVVAHAEARKVPRVAEGGEALALGAQLALRLLLVDVGRHDVHVVEGFLKGVLGVAQQNLTKGGRDEGTFYSTDDEVRKVGLDKF